MVKLEPAGTTSPEAGVKTESKPAVWATAVATKARTAAAENCILKVVLGIIKRGVEGEEMNVSE